MDDISYGERLDTLAHGVAQALSQADALELWDVSIGLDRARIQIDRLREAASAQDALAARP